jgi:RHS repeat-associated protein
MRNRFPLAWAAFFLLAESSLFAQIPTPPPTDNPEGDTGALKAQIQTAGSYDAHSGNATRIVNDLHVPGALGGYGLDLTRYWNSVPNDTNNADAEFPMDFGASGWSHSWKWTATLGTDDQQMEEGGGWQGRIYYYTTITITFPDGHANKYKVIRCNIQMPGQNTSQCPVSPTWGPPYRPGCGEDNWNDPGIVDDHLRDMAVDGSSFWLVRGDGGSVHFVDIAGTYQAIEVFDPNGFKTNLLYNSYGDLEHVVQEAGGRQLDISWGYLLGWGRVITQVATGGSAGSQSVTYGYKPLPGGIRVLAAVTYPNDRGTLQPTFGQYTWASETFSNAPVLRDADDPHFAGPMTSIHYGYQQNGCGTPPANDLPAAKWNYFYAQPEAIASESSSDHVDQSGQRVVVSQFGIGCFTGTRTETNGFGARRKFYFGNSAGDAQNKGYELGKETDFTTAATFDDVPFRHQAGGNHPHHIWDGRDLETQMSWDGSHPAGIVYADTSNCTYDWANATGSDTPDPLRIHNTPYRHWLFKKKDERGQWTLYTRDGRRRIKRIDYPADGSFEAFTYDTHGFNLVTSHRLASGVTIDYEYNDIGQLVRESNLVDRNLDGPIGDKVYTYDTLGRVETMTEGRAASSGAQFTVKMTYNGRHQVTSVQYISTSGPTVRYEYDWYGNCTAIIDELGHRKDYTYDAYRRCTSLIEQLDAPGSDCSGTVASRRWDWIYDRVIDGIGVTLSAFSHTSKEWRIQMEPVFNTGQRRATSRTFDVNNRMTSEQTGLIQNSVELLGTLHAVPGSTEIHYFAYDQNGQKSSYTDPLQRVTAYQYDNRNRLWKSTEFPSPNSGGNPRTTETQYNAAGNKTKVIFPDGKFQEWPDTGYDAFGQPHVFKDERGNTTNLDYWPWGPMKELAQVTTHRTTDGGTIENQLTKFFPDGLGRPWRTEFPDGTYEESNYQFGQIKTYQTRRMQKKVIDLYDARGREKHHYWQKPDGTVDGSTSAISRSWDDANRLTNIANAFSAIDYSYDSAGQAKWEGSNVAGGSGRAQVSYCRFPSGEVSRIVYPDTTTMVNPTYTVRGQLEGVGWPGGSTSYTYLLDGKVNSQYRTNGVTTSYGYDGRGMIGWVRHTKDSNGHDLAKRDYWRDTRDRIVAWKRGTDTTYNGMEVGNGNRYGYDAEGQLTAASYRAFNPETETPSGALRTDSFVYDELGNRMGGSNRVANRGPVNFTRRDNGLNQYVNWTPAAIRYDDNFGSPYVFPGNGVMMAEGWITASFNALNQPMAIWSQNYGLNFLWFGFDPLGRCVKRWTGTVNGVPVGSNPTTYFYYDGWNLVQERSSTTVADRTYVHGGRVDELVASQVDGVWNNHHYDGQGNCILLSTTAGGVQEQYDYDAFGFPYFYNASGGTLSSPPRTRFLFTGREWLSDLRIYDYRARQYQPELGRFLQPDPKQFDAGDYNLYRYCHNDPVNNTDPTGLMPDGWEGYECRDDVAKGMLSGAAVASTVLGAPVAYEAAGSALFNIASRIPFVARLIGLGAASGTALRSREMVRSALMPGGKAIGQAGTKEAIREVQGGLKEAKSLFQQLTAGGQTVKSNYPGTLVQVEGGGTIGIRTVATGSPNTAATIDVNVPKIPIIKIKFNE